MNIAISNMYTLILDSSLLLVYYIYAIAIFLLHNSFFLHIFHGRLIYSTDNVERLNASCYNYLAATGREP